MSKRKFNKRKAATASLDPATQLLLRQRERSARALLKRRRAKSGQ